MSDIFISYKREDQPAARRLADALEKEGWSVRWDPKLRAGDDFDGAIETALNESKCVIVVWSEISLKSDYVRAEATEALEQHKLVPVAIDNVNLPMRFKRLHTPKLMNWDGSSDSSEFRKLVEDISMTLDQPVKPAVVDQRASVKETWDEAGQGQEVGPTAVSKMWLFLCLGGAALVLVTISLVRWLPQQEQKVGEGPPKVNMTTAATLTPRTVFVDRLKIGGEGPEMVVVPGGRFLMGDFRGEGAKDEQPVHDVSIARRFAVSRNEITFEKYDQFALATGRKIPEDRIWGRERRPAINVSWVEARDYAGWLSKQTGKRYRLPSEAEWEYVARSGGKNEIWSGTSRMQELGDYAWYEKTSGGKTQPVGTKRPNAIGLYDMSGNVWEWVEDCWHGSYNGAPTDGSAWLKDGECRQRVIRGGAWFNLPAFLRSSDRNWGSVSSRYGGIGIRLVQDIE